MDPLPARRDASATGYRYADIGLKFAATIGVFTYAGYWADTNWGTRPWLMVAGVFLGFGLALYSMLAKIGNLSSTAEPPETESSSSEQSDA